MNATNYQISVYGWLILANVSKEPWVQWLMLVLAIHALYKFATTD